MSNSAFSLVDGGPLCRLIRRLGWVRPDGRCDYLRACLALVAVTWGPLFVLSMAERVVTGRVPSIDWSVHARLLVTIPLLFRAEASLHWRSQRAIGVFLEERWASDQADRVAKIIAFAEKLRDAAAPEVILLGLAVIGGQAVVWQAGGLRSFVSGLLLDPQQVAPKYWYALVSLPVFQFLLFRALWRWGIWAQLLWRLSRLRLRPIATHPDLAGGLGFLSLPSEGFAFVVAGLSATQAGVYANQIIVEDAALTSFTSKVVIFTLAAVVLALGPLIVFARHLVRCRITGGLEYDGLATHYTRLFHARWIERGERSDLLGSADIQALADLESSCEVVHHMRPVPFSPMSAILIAVAALAPMIPVALLRVPVAELLKTIGSVVLGKGQADAARPLAASADQSIADIDERFAGRTWKGP